MRSCLFSIFLVVLASVIPASTFAETYSLRVDGGLVLSHFEQQVKTEIGGERGEKLVTDTELGMQVMATWNFLGHLDLGIFGQVDRGTREAARFAGFDDQNRTLVTNAVGGSYTELWMGPLIRGTWRGLFAEFAYGALGQRWDDARDDLPSTSGDTESALSTSATVAWFFALGAAIPIIDQLDAVLRIEYRVRYYDARGGEDLADEIVHGTQNLTPFFGVAFKPNIFE